LPVIVEVADEPGLTAAGVVAAREYVEAATVTELDPLPTAYTASPL